MSTIFDPSHPPKKALSGSVEQSFGYKTLQSRLPVIVSKIVDDVYRTYHNFLDTEPNKAEKDKEAKKIIEMIGGLRYELQRDKPFRPLTDDLPDVQEWNQALEKYYPGSSWFKASWLFSECYLYRRIKETFALTQHWRDYDPFFEQKKTVFKSSQKAIAAIAVRLMSPSNDNSDNMDRPDIQSLSSLDILVSQGPESLGTQQAFYELTQVCLWGNATDLSLLNNPDLSKVEELQRRVMMSTSTSSSSAGTPKSSSSVSLDKQIQESLEQSSEPSELEKHAEKILQNDTDLLWEKVKNLRNSRVDIILDNAGFELYVDFMFADFLVRAGFASKVVFHAKQIPWFVSDVLPFDFQWTIDQLRNVSGSATTFFDPSDPVEQNAIKNLGEKWQSYVDQGVWKVTTDAFWTSCYAFHHLPTLPAAKELFDDMKESDLWIFKGDLNYRKLVYDCEWPTATPFSEAIGPLSHHEEIPHLVSFRTCKADVVVGLRPGLGEEMDKVAKDWMVSGEYAVISFS
ncbi:hypothetical protein BGZ76_003900 [Entomortierella beljakovae]|nr:hypothetical protein BGZ76_003900 [Entomortierella beljakovae]